MIFMFFICFVKVFFVISGLYLLVKFIIEVIFEFRVMFVIFLMVKCNVVYVVMIVILIKIILK